MTEERSKRGNAVYVRRHPRGRGKTSARAIRLQERRAEAYRHRRDGKSYTEISALMKLPPSSAQRYVQNYLESLGPSRETLEADRQRQLDRLDDLYDRAHQRVAEGDLAAIDRCRKIVETQARLQGFIVAQHGGGFNVQINNSGPGGDAETLGIRVIAPDWKPPINDPPPSNGWQDPPQLKALPAPRPNFGDTPEPPPPPNQDNVTPISRARYYPKDDPIKERAAIEGWTADRHPNPIMSAFQRPRGKGEWMR
jgi:hypothetical protein